jgi:hypothetical protein
MRPIRHRRQRAGMSAIELIVAVTVLTVAFGMYATTVTAVGRQRQILRESSLAGDACQDLMETMRSEPIGDVYALYNHDENDDPDGAGTAPGPRFDVLGLDPEAGADAVGEVRLPEIEVAPGVWELREDIEDAELGMPRDLNGDSIIDERNHAEDYVHLPVLIRAHWKGAYGTRRFELVALCTEFRR